MLDTPQKIAPRSAQRLEMGGVRIERLRAQEVTDSIYDDMDDVGSFVVRSHLVVTKGLRLWNANDIVSTRDCRDGDLAIFDGGRGWRVEQGAPSDVVRFQFPRAEVERFANENGRPGFETLVSEPGTVDLIIRGLSLAMLPSLMEPRSVEPAFVEHVLLAVMTHLTQNYGGLFYPPQRPGNLAVWQERRATEYLVAHINTHLSISDLAAECGLSRSYFIRAFRLTFGTTPYKWLMEYRISRAKEMLKAGALIADVASACGFSDQSHFTRTFSSLTGVTPGTWRRQLL